MSKILPCFRLVPDPVDEAAMTLPTFKWASPEVGHRHKLGGRADFVKDSEYPICTCGTVMSFYGQLDSLNDEFNLADCGVLSIFVCFGCFESKSILSTA